MTLKRGIFDFSTILWYNIYRKDEKRTIKRQKSCIKSAWSSSRKGLELKMMMVREKIRGFSKNENFNTSSSQAQTGARAKMRTENQRQPAKSMEPHRTPMGFFHYRWLDKRAKIWYNIIRKKVGGKLE